MTIGDKPPVNTDTAGKYEDSGGESSKEVSEGETSEVPTWSKGYSDSEFTDESSLIQLQCEICNQMVSDLDEHNLFEHPGTEEASEGKHRTRSHDCPECDETFSNIFELRKHMDNNHPNFFFFACKYCIFKTNHHQTLAAHIRKLHRSTTHSTSDDDESWSEPSKPESKHRNNRTCTECNKAFTRFDLNRHMDVEHPDVFLFSCDNCDFKTNYGQTMAAHKRRQQCVEYSLQKMFED